MPSLTPYAAPLKNKNDSTQNHLAPYSMIPYRRYFSTTKVVVNKYILRKFFIFA